MSEKNINKNGYQIRENILSMAIGILSDRIQCERENEYLKPEHTRQPVKGYDTTDVLSIADQLYEFINKK